MQRKSRDVYTKDCVRVCVHVIRKKLARKHTQLTVITPGHNGKGPRRMWRSLYHFTPP